jgi:2'-5' RNA ligase
MAVTKVSHASFSKGYTVQTGAGSYNLPREDTDSLYGPGWPVQPVTRPEDSELPRTLDYPVGINFTLQPRVGYAGLMPIAALKAAYSNVSEVSAPVNLIIRELCSFMPILRDPKTKQKIKDGHPYQWMCISPDRVAPLNVWLARYKKSAKVYAAPAFFMRKEQDRTVALEYIDGSTLFLIVNSRGNLPEPNEVDDSIKKFAERIQHGCGNDLRGLDTAMPALARDFLEKQRRRVEQGKPLVTTTPAFTQIIKGVPFSFWDKSQIYFVPEPPAPTVDSPYGETYIERSWAWINIISTMIAFELGHYRTGNTPEGLMMLPKAMFPSMTKLAAGEREWNARMADGSQVQHARNRWMPEGTQYIATKKPDFPELLYNKAKENILFSIGLPPSEMGDKPNQGLGGKGFESGAAHDVTRQILEAEKEGVEDAFNWVLLKEGVDDAEFYLDYPQEEIDPAQQQEDMWNKFSHGVLTLNDVLTQQGKEPVGDAKSPENVANMHIIISGSSIFVIEKMKIDEAGMAQPNNPQANAFGGPPNNPEDAIQGDKKGLPPQKGLPQAIARKIELGENLGGVMYSLPLAKTHHVDHTVAEDDPVLSPEGFDPDEYAMGLIEEQEHAGSVGQDTIPQIVLDHLREDPRYYTHLKEAGLAKVDITSHDGAMVALFIPEPVARQLHAIAEGLNFPPEARLELAENMHLTLALLPDANAAMQKREVILNCAKAAAAISDTPVGNIQGFGVFNGKAGEHVLYATLDCPALPELRQTLCNELDNSGIAYGREHGFVPHITLAYFQDIWQLPKGFMIPDMPVTINGVSLAIGENIETVPFAAAETLAKHCGVCPEDIAYAYAPVMYDHALAISPARHHANGVEVVTMQPKDLPAQIALWKPAGKEKDSLNESIGGKQYLREEAAWLLDQSLDFHLVPLAYTTETQDGEEGAAIWYTAGNTQRKSVEDYDYLWIIKAAVFDYLITQLDRRGKNYLTHPEEPGRMILIDNGYAFPVDRKRHPDCKSDFATFMVDKPLGEETLNVLRRTQADLSMWQDMEDLIGREATANVQWCLSDLLDNGMMRLS